jgi:hypothetical protein
VPAQTGGVKSAKYGRGPCNKGSFKTRFSGIHHAFNFAKNGLCYLVAFVYRFKQHFFD